MSINSSKRQPRSKVINERETDHPRIYVVGFPKSGNTWLARLLSNLLNSPIVNADPINSKGMQGRKGGKYLIEKTHAPSADKIPNLFSSQAIIYITRDVRDVMVSGFFFNHKGHAEHNYRLTPKLSLFWPVSRAYFLWHLRCLSDYWQGNIFHKFLSKNRALMGKSIEQSFNAKTAVGPWGKHVEYWVQQPGVVVVRYEDLLSDTYDTMTKILCEVGLPYDDTHLKNVVNAESFLVRKKAFEEEEDDLNHRFLRSGKTGDWQRFLTVAQAHRIVKCHHDAFKRMGYKE